MNTITNTITIAIAIITITCGRNMFAYIHIQRKLAADCFGTSWVKICYCQDIIVKISTEN